MKNEFVNLNAFIHYKDVPNQYSHEYIRSAKAVKIHEDKKSITIAVAKSMMNETGNALKNFHADKTLRFHIVSDSIFTEFIGNIVEADSELLQTHDFSTHNEKSDFSLDEVSSSSPVTNIINAVCLEAIRRNASDIHIQPLDTIIQIRFRLDGVLHTVKTLPKSIADSLVRRIKIMAHLDITEQRQPQDGRMNVTIENNGSAAQHNLRVSIIPAAYGESIVMRFFNIQSSVMTLDHLGFYPEELALLREAVKIPNGLILVTGPTGSGKTTTLHALIAEMNRETQNIITIEDPIERVLPGINQIQVNYDINITFENMLRRVLRQDPNVIMVGEIRDTETAELAMRSALTGHIIFSTLHTNDSISAVSRLANMGIEQFLIASVLRSVIAQRLVRKLCPHCKAEKPVPDFFKKLQEKYGIASRIVYEEKGCGQCSYTGYSGRTVIAELFFINSEIEQMISEHKTTAEIISCALENGMKTMEASAVKKVTDGITTINEVLSKGLLCAIQ